MVWSYIADEDDLETMIGGLEASVDAEANLMSTSANYADGWIEIKLGSKPTSPDDLVVMAATYYTYSLILHELYDTSDVLSPVAELWEKKAVELLEGYIALNPTDDEMLSPYSARQTPTRTFSKRNLKTVEDETDYDFQDDTRWDSE